MTERIQELARQAGSQHRLNLGVEEFCFEHHELKKFALLIVRECAGIYEKIDNGNPHMGTDDYLEALHKTFFGVKE